MKVEELMTEDPLVAEVPGNRDEVLQKLVENAVSGMPVVKARTNELAGVITRSDIFRSPQEEQVALIMTSDPFTVTPEDEVSEAARLFFEEQIHGLPVVDTDDGDELVGVISPSDVLRVLSDVEDQVVEDLITRDTSPVHEGTPLTVAWEVMNLTNWNAVPVLDDEAELSGIVVDSDLFQHNEVEEDVTREDLDLGADAEQASKRIGLIMPLYYANSRVDLPAKPVSDIMVEDVVTVFRKTDVGSAAQLMAKHEINQLPVLNNQDRLMGMVTDLDLMQAVAE